MSVGNLKDSGNQGNNFPYQLKMLKGLQIITDELRAINIDTDDLEQLLADLIAELQAGIDVTVVNTGSLRNIGLLRPTTGPSNLNTVQATFYSVSVANVGAANGTVLGQVIKPNEVLNFSGDAINNYFNSFAYDATGTEFIITYVY